MKKKILSALLASAMVLSLAACGSTPASTGGSDAASGGDAAPASGGEVVVYSPNSDTEVNAVIPAFEEATGIKVILQSMGTGDVLARLEAEKANPQADVNWGAVNLAFYTEHPDLYMEYVSPNDAALPEAYQNSTGYFTNTKLSGSAALLLSAKLVTG